MYETKVVGNGPYYRSNFFLQCLAYNLLFFDFIKNKTKIGTVTDSIPNICFLT